MGLKIEQKCSRCRRTNNLDVANVNEAVEIEKLEKAREDQARAIENFLNSIPADQMPDLIVFVKGQGTKIHSTLCDPADAKRSCLKRVGDLAAAMDELDERKPRAKKAKADVEATA